VPIARIRFLPQPLLPAGESIAGLDALARDFPTVRVVVGPWRGDEVAVRREPLDAGAWREAFRSFGAFDARVDDLVRRGGATLAVRGEPGAIGRAGHQMLTRWQRHLDRRNAASTTAAFDRALLALRAMHDLSKPLVQADWNHALDTWQWTLRLAPYATVEVQLAALLHDVERLESEADARVEHLAPSYVAFKQAHARRGAQLARSLVRACGGAASAAARVEDLVASHERPGEDEDAALLGDADGLSFFSQNSAGYADYFGPEQTRRKVAYTLGRMRPAAAARLTEIRLRADVAALVERAMTSGRHEGPRVEPAR
jgi:Domain of unknown function (DUF4202)